MWYQLCGHTAVSHSISFWHYFSLFLAHLQPYHLLLFLQGIRHSNLLTCGCLCLGLSQSLEATRQTPTQLVNFILVILEAAFVDSLLNMPKLLPSICFNELLWHGVCDKTLRVEAGKPVKRFLKPSSGKVMCENSVDHKYIQMQNHHSPRQGWLWAEMIWEPEGRNPANGKFSCCH